MLLAMVLGATLGAAPHVLALQSTSTAVHIQPAPDLTRIEASALDHVSQWQPLEDPLVTLPDGRQAKSSHVNGIEVDGVRYYYRIRYAPNADPATLGEVTRYQVVSVLEKGTQWETEIYRITE